MEDVEIRRIFHKSDRIGLVYIRDDLEAKLAAEKEAHAETDQLRSDYEESLNGLQTRLENKTRDLTKMRSEKEDVDAALAAALRRVELQTSEITEMKHIRAELTVELEYARNANKASNIPGVAEMEKAKGETRMAKLRSDAMENKTKEQAKELDYLRSQYQKVSNAAVESATRIATLERELETANRKAKGEAAKLAEINIVNALKQAHDEVDRVRMEIKSRETLLRRKEEEIRDLKRGRGGAVTRGSSVGGKSPRGGGSRTGSPGPTGGKVGGSALRFG